MVQPIRLPLIDVQERGAAETLSEHYRHLAFLALEAQISPKPVEIAGLRTAPMRLSVGMLARLQESASKAGVDLKVAFASLCLEGQLIQKRQRTEAAGLVVQAQPLDMSLFRSAQQGAFYRGMAQGLNENKIVLCEGSTGLGKGRVIAMAAIEQVRAGKTPVVIAAPSLALVGQLHAEVMALADESVPVAVVVGANEFVDDEALLLYLARAHEDPELPVDEAVKLWALGGGKPLKPDSIAALAGGVSAAWLMDDLRALCDLMPAADFSLSEDAANGERSEARAVVQAMRAKARNVEGIVLCSHMMLAAAQRTRWKGTLPAPRCLLVDEAHLFESAVARVNSVQLSLFSMRVSLKRFIATNSTGPQSTAANALRDLTKLGDVLQPFGDMAKGGSVVLNDPDALSPDALTGVVAAVGALKDRISSKTMRGVQHIELYQQALDGLLRGLSSGALDNVQLHLSAVRGYPTMDSGPASVAIQLADIWKTAEGGVALVSATMFSMGEDGEYHCDFMRNVLSIPLSRIATPAPVREPHITAIPTVYTVGEAAFADFVPPSDRGAEGSAQWMERVAGAVREISFGARGGTLVLCTAYEDVRGLAERLAHILGERMVIQTPAHRFGTYVAEFKAKHAAGLRPILVGVGVAWTGVDLVDTAVPAHEDWMLTDLVVVRLPINLNQSTTSRRRAATMGLYPLVNECLLSLKQGLGRLIRRAGVTERNIWVLDGRIHPSHTWQGMVRLTAGARRLLRDYPKRREVDFR
ncbi:helicase C-terminal domain-containing protein [Acidovorax sp.]|uniref:helicase C-terminal domain-containing protein n=1 Tax=Acidovorax sp. TaxID=1872122 RepID=UPI00391F9688